MLSLSACGSILATALTDHEVCTIAMGRDWKKHDEAKVHLWFNILQNVYLSTKLMQRSFSSFIYYTSHMLTLHLAKVWNYAEMWRAQSRIQRKMIFSQVSLVVFMSPQSISDSLIHWVWTCVNVCFVLRLLPMMRCGPYQTCDCDMCPQTCDIHFT